jgi:putative GTP pyrophosphokinase
MEIDRSEIGSEFAQKEPGYKRLLDESLFILEQGLVSARVKYHSIPTRIKRLDSLLAKAERRSEKGNPLDQITDIVGLRVVCLFLSDISRIGTVIRRHFEVITEDNKIEGSEVSSFGYMSVHFIAKMKKTYSGPRYDGLVEMPFEIQVRTIAMDAWATISHYLDYKSEIDVPTEMRRDFYALSGLFYVADTHFEMFFKERERGSVEIRAGLEAGKLGLDQELNLDTLRAYLAQRFTDRTHSPAEFVSKLVSELHSAGYKNLAQLDDAIENGYEGFLTYEKGHQPVDGKRFADVGVVRILLSVNDAAYRAVRRDTTDYSAYIRPRRVAQP